MANLTANKDNIIHHPNDTDDNNENHDQHWDNELEKSEPIHKIENQRHLSGMTPSIITTINNTSPSPQTFDNQSNNFGQNNIGNNNNNNNNNSNNNTNLNSSRRKKSVPQSYYESYIEDSFVGHWEREDDDIEDDNNYPEQGADDDSDSILHSSTIEFDFDSFGPESIIYAPTSNKVLTTTNVQKQSQQTIPSENLTSCDTTEPIPGSSSVEQHIAKSTDSKDNAFNNKKEDDLSHQIISDDKKVENELDKPSQNVSPKIVDNQREIFGDKLADTSLTTRRPVLPSQIIDSPVDEAQIDLKVIEPYRRVISHAGYCHFMDPANPSFKPDTSDNAPAVIVFSSCYLPDRSRRDYDYVMDHLFLYVLSSLHELIADDYILIFFHNTQPSTATTTSKATSSNVQNNTSNQQPVNNNNLPTFTWIKRCYQLIGRKLRKNLRVLYLVKPTFWLKTIVIMCKPFISSKFSKKIHFIEDMDGLKKCLPVDKLILPASADNL